MSRPPRIDVWVCARPHAPELGAALAALETAGAKPRVVVSPPGRGPATARNEALAACDGEVLALVDDDVEVSAGWLEALRGAWSRPGAEELGCVGGPLGATFVGDRPAWLVDALLPALGVDGGPSPEVPAGVLVPVDAADRTFYGGNVSFRVAALRGVGGFWPAHGQPDQRDWFGEEHRAQHELARAGWRRAWIQEAYAARRIARHGVRALDVVRMRALYGARWGAVGAPSRGTEVARAAASATAGVLVAAARRDDAKLVERACRAAQNAGLLAAPVLAHRSLQPTASRTQYMFSVPPPAPGPVRGAVPRLARRARNLGGGAPIVLLYHRVATGPEDPGDLMVSPRHFMEQLEVLTTRRTPVPLEEIAMGQAPPDAVAVTVDDGYADVLEAALPELIAAGVPATVFVSTGHVGSGGAFWWDAVARLLRGAPADAGPLQLVIDGELRVWPARDAAERRVAFQGVAAWLHPQAPETIDDALTTIAEWAGAGDPFAPPPEDRPMTVDELRRLAASPLVAVGSHGRDHPCLAAQSLERQAADLAGAREDISDWLGRSPAALAYPFGIPGIDVDAATRAAAREAGYAYAVVNGAHGSGDAMAIPRIAVGDAGADEFDAWLKRVA